MPKVQLASTGRRSVGGCLGHKHRRQLLEHFPRLLVSRRHRNAQANHACEEKWSQDVTEHSDALALEPDVFKSDDPKDRKVAEKVGRG